MSLKYTLRVSRPAAWRGDAAARRISTARAEVGRDVARDAQDVLARDIEESGAVATRTLVRGVRAVLVGGATEYWQVALRGEGRAADYIVPASEGRRPGQGFFSGWLFAWLDALGISRRAAYPIGRRIAEEGTAGAGYLRRTTEELQSRAGRYARQWGDRIAALLGGR